MYTLYHNGRNFREMVVRLQPLWYNVCVHYTIMDVISGIWL